MEFIRHIYRKLKALFRLFKVLAGVNAIDPIEINHVVSSNEVFPLVSKSGCSSVKLCIIRRFVEDYESEFPKIHKIDIEELTNGEIVNHVFPQVKAYEAFCRGKNIILVVRDPYHRFVSCYRDVISGKNTMYFYPSRLNELLSFSPTISLADFFRVVSWIPDRFADRHFRSQSYYLTQSKSSNNQSFRVVDLVDFVEPFEQGGTIRLNKGQNSEDEKMIQWLKQNKKFQRRYKTDIELYATLNG